MWSDGASSRMPDLISVLFKLHILKSLWVLTFIRGYVSSSFKVLYQISIEKVDLTIMELKQNLCPGVTSKLIDLQPIMIHLRIFLITERVYKENKCGRTTHQVVCRI